MESDMSYQDRQRRLDPQSEQDYEEAEPEPVLVLTRRRVLWIGGAVVVALLALCVCCALMAGAFFLGRETASTGGADSGPAGEATLPAEATAPAEATEAVGQAPQAAIVGPSTAQLGQPVEFDGSTSQPGSSPIAGYDWQFGDGGVGQGARASHVYNVAGTYQVTLIVTDGQGLSGTSAPHQVTVQAGAVSPPAPPTISTFAVSPAEIAPGGCVQISWAVSGDVTQIRLLRDGAPLTENAGAAGQQQDCPPQAGNYIYRLEAVNAAGQAAAQEQALSVVAGGGEVAPSEDPLAGTGWELAAILASQAPLPDTSITLLFNVDGTVSGNGGCNDYSGPYMVTGDVLSIGPLSTAGTACSPEIDSQEQDYLMLLGSAVNYQIIGTQLSLTDPTGAEVLRFNSTQ
jgi:heat shock protein HslJ